MTNLKYIIFSLAFFSLFFSGHENSNAQFGKNIVQYKEFDWKFVKSAHFDIYFYDDSEYLAEFAARMAEDALISIEYTLNFKIDKRISFLVYNSHNEFQQTNVISMFMSEGIGGVTESMKNRIVVPFEGDYEKFRHVIHHELVHGVINQMLMGGTVSTSLRTGSMVRLPLWMSEGLAEFESNHIYDSPSDMFMRDISLNESLPDLNRISGYAAYRAGQAFYWYVERKYGRERIGELINRIRTTGSLKTAFESTFNLDVKKFSKQWKNDMKKYYWPDIARFDAPDEFAERITDAREDKTYYNSSPAISADGSKMAFISAPGASFGIFIKDLSNEKSKPKRIISSNRQQDFEDLNMLTPGISWSPDGKKLVVSAKAGATDAVYFVDVESGDYDKKIFKLKSIHSVTWSPDGKLLTFVGASKEQSDIFLYDIDKDILSNLTADIFSESIPAWGADSETIFFVSDRGEYITKKMTSGNIDVWNYNFSVSDIYSVDVKISEISRLTFTPNFMKTSLAGAPDNQKILFVSDDNGIGNVYQLTLDDLKAKPLTNSLTGITQISLSGNGDKMLFATQLNGGYDIFLMRHPFEKKFDADTLELTKFRSDQIQDMNNLIDDAEYENLDRATVTFMILILILNDRKL
jgi:Tol biopolymer transport system component